MQNKTEIVCVLDKSGSMSAIINDAIGGFNTFIEDQKKLNNLTDVTIVQFDSSYRNFFTGELQLVPALSLANYIPGGSTSLLDAIGQTINDVGTRLHNTPVDQRPDRVLFIIVTDGEENTSKEFKREQIFNMITHQKEKYSWEFIFLAANQDAISVAGGLGINKNLSINFSGTGVSTRSAYGLVSNAVSKYLSTENDAEASVQLDQMLNSDIQEDGTVIKRPTTLDPQP